MKVRILLDGGKPKVSEAELRAVIQEAGLEVGEKADFGIVVGGDGRFSRYGRTEDIPLLFVGVRSKGATGSKAYLAATTFDRLLPDLKLVKKGRYTVEERRRLKVSLNGKGMGEVFTDVYLGRGAESTCLRYNVNITGKGEDLHESAIGDGVVVSAPAGATGYFSYPDRMKGDWMDPGASSSIEKDEVGICHIAPTFTERTGTTKHPLRYKVPWGSKVEISLFRRADARIYGTTDSRSGVKVGQGDTITVTSGRKLTRVIVLRK